MNRAVIVMYAVAIVYSYIYIYIIIISITVVCILNAAYLETVTMETGSKQPAGNKFINFSSSLRILPQHKYYDRRTSIDVLPSKNQALCKYCTHVNNYYY